MMRHAWGEPTRADFLCGTAFTVSLPTFGVWLALAFEGNGFDGSSAAIDLGLSMAVLVLVAPGLALFGLLGWRRERANGHARPSVLVLGLACFIFAGLASIGIAVSPPSSA